MSKSPPKFFLKFFRWFCHPRLVKPIEGDLMELYDERLEALGKRKADQMFRKEIILLFRKDMIKPASGTYRLTNYGMFKHNIKLAFRNFLGFKSSFLINLIGLSSGLASVFLIYLWIADEWSHDKFHENEDRIYQVMQNINNPDEIWTMPNTQALLAEALVDEMPEVEMAVSVLPVGSYGGDRIVEHESKKLKINEQYASKDFFNLFSFELLEGNKDNVLAEERNVAISEEYASKLFGADINPIGQTLTLIGFSKPTSLVVSGIFKNPPRNSSQQFDAVFTMELFLSEYPHIRDWENSDPSTYLLVKEQADISTLAQKLEKFVSTKKEGYPHTHFLQKFSETYLYNNYEDGKVAGGRIQYVHLFSIIAILVLAIACINFMNLSTARASRRLKEIGVKKAMGAQRGSLMAQYYTEALLITGFAILLGIAITTLSLSFFNDLTGKSLELNFSKERILFIAIVGVVTALVSASYPALYLSGFDVINIFKGKISGKSSDLWIRRGLVVFQFTVSILLITAILVVSNQMEYIQNKNLGFTKEQVIYFNADANLESNQEAFLETLRQETSIHSAAAFEHDLLGDAGTTSGIKWEGKEEGEFVQFGNLEVGLDLIETFELEITEGRSFSEDGDFGSTIIFNEKAIEVMGIDDPIGKTVELWRQERIIIGVVKDFHFKSLHEEITPCFIHLNGKLASIVVRLKTENTIESIERIEEIYQSFNPGLPFTFKFLDTEYDRLYRSEKQIAGLSKSLGIIAIIISCLGLFGLVSFTTEKRRKEMSVRKILGSSELNLVILLTGDFSKIVFTAVLIAIPLSYYMINVWLQSFAYSIEINLWYFILPSTTALLISWITMGFQTLKEAKANPVESLKDE